MARGSRGVFILCWAALGATVMRAGDCAAATDCTAIPDNASKAVVVVSILAGAGFAFRNRNGGDDSTGDPAKGGDGPTDPAGGDSAPPPPATQPSPPAAATFSAKDALGALGEDPPDSPDEDDSQ